MARFENVCSVYYQSQVHSKYFCLTFRLENISWKLSVTIIYTCCTSITHFNKNTFCFMAWLENILQFILSGKPVWRSGLKTWFCGYYRLITVIIHLKWKVSFVWYQVVFLIYCFLHYTLFIFLISILAVIYNWLY